MRVKPAMLAFVALVLLGAIFVDGYTYIYRLATHQGFSKPITSNPNINGFPLYIHKGLDIQGGTEVTVVICHGANDPAGSNCRHGLSDPNVASNIRGNYAQAQTLTIPVLTKRVNSLGVSDATVSAQGNDEILIELPGVSLQQALQTIGTTAKLHFATAVPGPVPSPSDLAAQNAAAQQFLNDQQGLFDPAQLGNPTYYPTGYHWKIDDKLPASDVTSATAGFNSQTNQPVVDISFNGEGAAEWNKITTAAFAQPAGSAQNLVAIFLDDTIISDPAVQGVSGASTEISGGNITTDVANTLASQINSGALPADISVIQQQSISATLGQDTVKQTLIAGAIGLIVVVLFMMLYYRFPGILASIALICYSLIVLAIFKILGISISLAGLAGFVLSVGMAVDANVLIFERIRDELRHGRSIGIAVEAGFARARLAIRDSNISTSIACVVLILFGTGLVKGFAITLLVGVAVSFFSAVTITRSLLALALRWNWSRNPRLYTRINPGFADHPPKGKFDIVRSRNLYFLGSLVVIVPGLLAIIFWGFNLGLDFTGGININGTITTHPTTAQVVATVDKVASDLRPQAQLGTDAAGHTTFTVETESAANSAERIAQIQSSINNNYHLLTDPKTHQPTIQAEDIGPSVASDLVKSAVLLVVIASICIALYLGLFAFRQQRSISAWRFSVCTFFKLLHDVFVIAGIWAILGHFSNLGQVDTLFITAVLTSVAFSIHDTIVVFDRVRENLRTGPKYTFDQVINLSTVQTMTRSLNTALTVVFVLLSLVLFGGDTIRGFVLALLIGIVTGTYSSIFNASTLLVAWEDATAESKSGPRPSRRASRVAA
jgi:SecD/SecF fusion protein